MKLGIRGIWFLVAGFCLLGGCVAERVDGSSQRRMEETLEGMRLALPDDRKGVFDQAILEFGISTIAKDAGKIEFIFTNPLKRVDDLRSALDGKTADEIIKEAEGLRAKRLQEEKEAAERRAARQLADIVVSDLVFDGETAQFKIKNKTSRPLTRVDMELSVFAPDADEPILKETVAGPLPEPLKVFREQEWTIPTEFGTEIPENARLEIRMVAAYGEDGNVLWELDK
jgi:hypothetical protein